jgi:hypothetical protein
VSDPAEPVVLATYDSRHEAQMALGILEDAQIAAAIHPDDGGSMEPALAFQGRVRLMVAGDEAGPARELLSDAGFLHDVVPPTWSARPAGGSGPSLTRDLSAMALLFGGVALLVLEMFLDLSGESNALAYVGAVGLAVGGILTYRSIAEAREARRRTD